MNPAYRNIKAAVLEEIGSLVKLYSYNIKRFLDAKILHASSMFVFYDSGKPLEKSFLNKAVSLATGMELLAAGLKLHNFNSDDFIFLIKDEKLLSGRLNEKMPYSASDLQINSRICKNNGINEGSITDLPKREISDRRERNYTLSLLFGDILYSRASVYILEYGDHELFNTILGSLKSVHKNKLLLHQKLVETIKVNHGLLNIKKNSSKTSRADFKNIALKNQSIIQNEDINIIEENETLLAAINALLKTSFITGWGIFCGFDDVSFPYSIINDFVMLKTYSDMEGFFKNLSKNFDFLKNSGFINDRKNNIKEDLASKIEKVRPISLKSNFKLLYKIYTGNS
ncbi:MAG: hypothetical protein JW997_05875 [Actinobacteria bacterium]|nr:hypothetical protein [Actinomycetota bacterium]